MGIMKKLLVVTSGLGTIALFGFVATSVANAATTANSTLSQAINAGVLSTDIRDAGGGILSNPTFSMSAVSVSTSQQTATGTFGSSSQRITVDNPAGANSGWTLALNATTPGTGTWTSGGNTYAYNGATAALGQLTVNPAAGTITPVTGTSTGVTLGTSATFASSTAITLVSAAAGSDDVWNGYVTGVSLSQTIPAAKPAGTYTISMTQTVTAL
jgi:hypothetical protein